MPKQLYRDHYRVSSIRLPEHNYAQPGTYFITICTKMRYPWFGHIQNKIMCISNIGAMAYYCWQQIPKHFLHVAVDTFIVMPDHIHGIITIQPQNRINSQYQVYPQHEVETQNFASLQRPYSFNVFGPQSKNLGSIVRGFKIGVKKYATLHNIQFHWQPRYYERIVRNERELNIVRKYILDNPKNWTQP